MTINNFSGQPVELTEKEELAYKLIQSLKIATQSLLPSYEDIKGVAYLVEQLAATEASSEEEGK